MATILFDIRGSIYICFFHIDGKMGIADIIIFFSIKKREKKCMRKIDWSLYIAYLNLLV